MDSSSPEVVFDIKLGGLCALNPRKENFPLPNNHKICKILPCMLYTHTTDKISPSFTCLVEDIDFIDTARFADDVTVSVTMTMGMSLHLSLQLDHETESTSTFSTKLKYLSVPRHSCGDLLSHLNVLKLRGEDSNLTL